jgi:hypothetical protein
MVYSFTPLRICYNFIRNHFTPISVAKGYIFPLFCAIFAPAGS